MQKRIEIEESIFQPNTLQFIGIDKETIPSNLTASGQMLVDSDSLAFIYKLENEEEFVYVSLPYHTWSDLHKVRKENIPVTLKVNGQEIVLWGIIEELEYLISNIEGNANYGEEMVARVEEIFLAK